jgi:hypothetical protein
MMEWISVKDRLPEYIDGKGSYGKKGTGVVLVIHKDRPDYPMTAHACYSNEGVCSQGVAIETKVVEGFKYVEWYTAVKKTLQNPFDLKNDNYEKYLPNIFGSKITHWMPLPSPPKGRDK